MNYPEFMTAVIEIYGQYQSETLKKLTAVYIKERWDEKELESIFKQLLLKKPSRYKTPPDPAEFEEIFPKKSLETEALFWFDKLSKTGNSLDNIIISDNRAEQAIISFGGWTQFCQRDPENEHWHRKNFVDAFCKPVEKRLPQIIYGQSRNTKKQPLMFGDISICQDALTYSNPADKMIEIQFNKLEGMK